MHYCLMVAPIDADIPLNPEVTRILALHKERVTEFISEPSGLRATDKRTVEAVGRKLAGLKGRVPVGRVTSHVCRHEDGIGFCVAVDL